MFDNGILWGPHDCRTCCAPPPPTSPTAPPAVFRSCTAGHPNINRNCSQIKFCRNNWPSDSANNKKKKDRLRARLTANPCCITPYYIFFSAHCSLVKTASKWSISRHFIQYLLTLYVMHLSKWPPVTACAFIYELSTISLAYSERRVCKGTPRD